MEISSFVTFFTYFCSIFSFLSSAYLFFLFHLSSVTFSVIFFFYCGSVAAAAAHAAVVLDAELDDQIFSSRSEAATKEWNASSLLLRLTVFHPLHSN